MPTEEYKIYFNGRYYATAYSKNDIEYYKNVAEYGGFKFEVEEISLI